MFDIFLKFPKAKLTNAIDNFLRCTMQCTPRWCNKPKFHLLLHLPEHICMFGPAIIYAMEKFESYNSLICDCSTHSNRQAPSRDISQSLACANRIRHLLSGGKFHMGEMLKVKESRMRLSEKKDTSKVSLEDLSSVGKGVLQLMQSNEVIQRFCSFPAPQVPSRGEFCAAWH